MTKFHYRGLPDFSALLAGPTPPDEFAFLSDRLQVSYFNTMEGWKDLQPHAHRESDEFFLVLRGEVIVEVEGEPVSIGQREFCGFPRGTFHQVVEVRTPVECLVIRNSAGYDKIYRRPDGTTTTERTYHQDLFGMLNGGKEISSEQ